MKISIDQMGHEVRLDATPKRIISLVPSQTELLFDLGLDSEVVGVTKFCCHPPAKVTSKVKIGGTKRFVFSRIFNLAPDLIIANKEENYVEGINELMEQFPVWVSDVNNLTDAYAMIRSVGDLVDRQQRAEEIIGNIKSAFAKLVFERPIRAAYFIWRKPYMIAAADTFVDNMLQHAGFINAFSDLTRYPEVNAVQLTVANPEVILLSSEPYPFTQEHYQEFKTLCPDALVLTVDGEMFSWYGSRLQYMPAYFEELHAKITAMGRVC